MSRAFELMLAEVHRYEGTVNQFLGDGIMALFGAPIAHEDHARRAVHAALGIARALEAYQTELRAARHQLPRPPGPQHRPRGGGQHRQRPAHGLHGGGRHHQRRGAPAAGGRAGARDDLGGDPSARPRLLRDAAARRASRSRARPSPSPAWEVVAARETRTRLEVEADRGLTPVRGARARAGLAASTRSSARGPARGRWPSSSASAGIGKSRLLLELRRRIGDGAATGRRATACRSGRPWHSTRWSTCSGASSASRRATARRPSPRRSSAA